MTQSIKIFQQRDLVETRYTITGLDYDAEYEVKLFAVNEQGDSEPDVRRFKTKRGIYIYLKLLTLPLVKLFKMKLDKYYWVLPTGVALLLMGRRIVELCDNSFNTHAAALV